MIFKRVTYCAIGRANNGVKRSIDLLNFYKSNDGEENMIDVEEKISSVYTAHSKHFFFARKMISAFVLKENYLPLNPFTNWDYFMNDMVDRNLTVRANNNLIINSDEFWQFGIISNGCYHEIKLAIKLNKVIKFFSLGKKIEDIKEIAINNLSFEEELKDEYDMNNFLIELKNYINKK